MRDLDYLDADIDQFIRTPVQVAATMTNKLAGALLATCLPFLAVKIDVR